MERMKQFPSSKGRGKGRGGGRRDLLGQVGKGGLRLEDLRSGKRWARILSVGGKRAGGGPCALLQLPRAKERNWVNWEGLSERERAKDTRALGTSGRRCAAGSLQIWGPR